MCHIPRSLIHSHQIDSLIRLHIDQVKYSSDVTQELLLIFDKIQWISIFWNPVSQQWRVAIHDKERWRDPMFVDSQGLFELLGKYRHILPQVFAIQFRTAASVQIYLNTPD
uniref:Uncharacterized protein n=1 Tax=Marseillevirus LCMAC102 TaxID=2506603 RepID=A0A481YUE3_9VIRU|nr:MAG: hypothetical protein LCMAC102_02960 [Marseillevirus LCMAC102]